jgi:hypothetical protein
VATRFRSSALGSHADSINSRAIADCTAASPFRSARALLENSCELSLVAFRTPLIEWASESGSKMRPKMMKKVVCRQYACVLQNRGSRFNHVRRLCFSGKFGQSQIRIEHLDRVVHYTPLEDPGQSTLFLPGAISNPIHLKFALKGFLAGGLSYITFNALFWPGIATSVYTCVVTALTTIGASHQRQVLRFAGALTGGIVMAMAQKADCAMRISKTAKLMGFRTENLFRIR